MAFTAKAKFLPRFPSTVLATAPLSVAKSGGTYTFAYNPSALTTTGVPSATAKLVVRDGTTFYETLANNVGNVATGVSAGSYSNMNATVDLYGRITAAANGELPIIYSTDIASISAGDQALIFKGVLVSTSTDSKVWAYSGTGSKVLEASYLLICDKTPEWTAIQNKPPFAKIYPTRTAAAADDLTGSDFCILGGRTAVGDCPIHLYKRFGSTPSPTNSAYHFQDSTGAWFELQGFDHSAHTLGVVGNGSTDDTTASIAAKDYFKLRGGGRLWYVGGKSYVIAGEVNFYDAPNLLVTSVGGKPNLLRTTLLNTTPVFSIRSSGTPATNVKIIGFKLTHTDAGSLTYTATAAQTTFVAPAGGSTALDFIVFKNSTLLQSQTPDFSYSAGNIILTVGATAGDTIIIKRTSANAASAGFLNQGVSAASQNVGCEISDIEIASDGSLYIGVNHQWHTDTRSTDLKVTGIANRGIYNYGKANNFYFDNIYGDGTVNTGVLSGKRVTDYIMDGNAYDGSNAQTNGFYGNKIHCVNAFRGFSLIGNQTGCSVGQINYSNIVTYGVLLQDSSTAGSPTGFRFESVNGSGAGVYGFWSMMGSFNGGSIDCQTSTSYGVYIDYGNVGSSESYVNINQISARSGSSIGVYVRGMIAYNFGAINAASNGGTGVYFSGSQLGNSASIVANNNTGSGVLYDGTCYRNNARVTSYTNTTYGVRLEASSYANLIDGRCYNNTTANVSDVGTANVTASVIIL